MSESSTETPESAETPEVAPSERSPTSEDKPNSDTKPDESDSQEASSKSSPKKSDNQESGAKKSSKKSGAKKSGKKSDGAQSVGKSSSESQPSDDTALQRFVCVHCGHRFEEEKQPKRCPSCMRQGGLELQGPSTSATTRPWLVPVLVAAGAAAIAGGYIYWNQASPDQVEGDAPLSPLSTSELRGYLRAENADGAAADLFESSDAVAALAESAAGSGAQEKAAALTQAIRDRAEARAFVRWSFEQPRTTPPHNAEWAASQLGEESSARLYPLEVVAAAVAALREADVDAMVAEVWAFPGDRTPPDPSGHVGYFAVAVYDGPAGEGEPTLYDPYLGHSTKPDSDSYRVLTDVQAVGAYWNLIGLHEFVHENNSQRALEHVQRALSLDRRSPSIRTVRGAILLASGGGPEGLEELRSAAQIRADSPRRVWVAATYLDSDPERATREVAAALEAHPDFAFAHATLGAVYMSQHELEQARQELAEAERLDPHLRDLPLYWSQYHLLDGNPDLAAQKALEAVERQPNMLARRLQVAQILKQTGDFDGMRRQARAALELVDEVRREPLREHILQMLGATALDEPIDEMDVNEDLEPESVGGGQFQLDSELLGGDDGPNLGGSLLDEELGGGSPGLQLGDPSGLRLRGPGGSGGGGDFQLRLNN